MSSFSEHITQAKSNLNFLEEINNGISKQYWDWNVTACFYVAVHLVNSHIAQKGDLHYRSHSEVKNALNPFEAMSVTKVPEKVYTAYTKLQNLSRRSRYLISDNMSNTTEDAQFTYDRHYKKALGYLNTWLSYISEEYGESFDKTEVDCIEARNTELKYFIVK